MDLVFKYEKDGKCVQERLSNFSRYSDLRYQLLTKISKPIGDLVYGKDFSIKIESDDSEIPESLDTVFYKLSNLEYIYHFYIQSVCKYNSTYVVAGCLYVLNTIYDEYINDLSANKLFFEGLNSFLTTDFNELQDLLWDKLSVPDEIVDYFNINKYITDNILEYVSEGRTFYYLVPID